MAERIMLNINHIAKTFNPGTITEKRALTDVDLKLNEGDFVTIIGGNGAGKSTTLNAVAGVFTVDQEKNSFFHPERSEEGVWGLVPKQVWVVAQRSPVTQKCPSSSRRRRVPARQRPCEPVPECRNPPAAASSR